MALGCCVIAACSSPTPLPPIVTGDYQELPLSEGAEVLAPVTSPPPQPPDLSSCGALASLPPERAIAPGAESPDSVLARIAARGRLIVGADQNTNLFSFRDPATGALEGFDIDLAREIARDFFGDPSRVEFRLLTSAGRFEALEDNDVDLVIHATTITCERAERVAFSTVYFIGHQRILVPKGSGISATADLADKRLCSYRDTTSLATMQRVAPPTTTIVAVPDWDDCLVMLQQGLADATSTDDSVLAGLQAQDSNLEIVGPNLSIEPYGVGVNKENDDLVRFVNATLERIRADGTWMKMYNTWFQLLGPVTGPPEPTYR
ncbi:glutamate ABC transporter substrate-binding protein [Rhodococcus koreensis]